MIWRRGWQIFGDEKHDFGYNTHQHMYIMWLLGISQYAALGIESHYIAASLTTLRKNLILVQTDGVRLHKGSGKPVIIFVLLFSFGVNQAFTQEEYCSGL